MKFFWTIFALCCIACFAGLVLWVNDWGTPIEVNQVGCITFFATLAYIIFWGLFAAGHLRGCFSFWHLLLSFVGGLAITAGAFFFLVGLGGFPGHEVPEWIRGTGTMVAIPLCIGGGGAAGGDIIIIIRSR